MIEVLVALTTYCRILLLFKHLVITRNLNCHEINDNDLNESRFFSLYLICDVMLAVYEIELKWNNY